VQPGNSDPEPRGAPDGAAFSATASARRNRRAPAVVVLVSIAFLGVAFLARQATSDVSAPIASDTAQTSQRALTPSSAVGSATPAQSSPSLPPARDPEAKPYPTFVAVPVRAGPTRLVPAGSSSVGVTANLPRGWERASAAMYVTPRGTASVGMSIGAWVLLHVNLFPCRWATPTFSDDLFDHTAEGQAQALSAWWGQDADAPFSSNESIAPIATRPVPTSIAGHPAWYVELLVPSVFDFTKCDGGQLVLWQAPNGDVRYALGPGELDRLWVVDVDGRLIVIDAGSSLLASSADQAALQGIIDSITFEP